MALKLKRVYEPAGAADGFRILVDRLWPRGVSKASARIDLWLKDVAPSTALRKWFGHDPLRWNAFRTRYFRELDQHAEVIARLLERIHDGKVTLVYGAKDQKYNHAVALKQYLESRKAS